ncbi:MAG: 30S ribosomal protein S2 [bacterium]
MIKLPSLLEMLKAGVHFGHQTSRWHPKMEEYIFGTRNGVHILNLERTQVELEKTLKHVQTLASQGKVVLFVGTKHQARNLIKQAAENCEMPYLVERWIGGLLTNFGEVKIRLKKYRELKEQLESGEIEKYSKKEQLMMKKKLERMDKYLIGLTSLTQMPDYLYIADLRTEKTAVSEALRMKVPVIAVTDSNVNPDKASHIIPANDDAVNSIKMMADLVSEAIKQGRMEWEKKKVDAVKEFDKNKVETGKKERKALRKEEV